MKPLEMTRISAWAINHLLNHYEIGSMAIKFNGDDDNWHVGHNSTMALVSGRMAAKIEFDGKAASIYIPDIHQVIRPEHIKDFRPEEHGIEHKWIEDFKGDVEDDIMAELDIDRDLIPGIDGPRRMVPKSPIRRKINIGRALR